MSLLDDLATDMDNAFLDSGFEESVSYTSMATGAAVVKTIDAVIFRGTEKRLNFNIKGQSGDAGKIYETEIYVSRTYLPIIKINSDKVSFKKYPGDTTNTTFNVAGIIRMDAGAFRLGLV